ncbi:MAG: hypothetical protein Tsb0010_01860 [Parvularculaceae bacterium]
MKNGFEATFAAAKSAFAVLAFVSAMIAAQAQAQGNGPVILIVNQAALLSQSQAGQNIAEQMAALQETVNGELQAEADAITKEAEDLQAQRDLVSEEVFLERARALAVRERSFPAFREVKLRELQLTQQRALAEIGRALQPILQEVVEQRGATLLLDRSAVMYNSADTDITADVMARLNENLTSVPLERVVLTREQSAQQQQQ